MKPSERLAELGITLPTVAAPIGSYIPAVRTGNYAMCSGQLPFREGKVLFTGKVSSRVALGQAAEAARIAAINGLAACAHAVGGVDRIVRVVRVCVFVNSDADFTEHPKVANGASDLLTQVFGEAGRHARSAVGVAALPLDSTVEVELMVEVT